MNASSNSAWTAGWGQRRKHEPHRKNDLPYSEHPQWISPQALPNRIIVSAFWLISDANRFFSGHYLIGKRYLVEAVLPSRINSLDSTNLLNNAIACPYPIPSNKRHCLLVIKPFCITNLITFCLTSSVTSIFVTEFILRLPAFNYLFPCSIDSVATNANVFDSLVKE